MRLFNALTLSAALISASWSYTNNFDNILLIINYNHPHYQSIPLLKKVYGAYFKNIVFYGPQQHKDVHYCAHYMGYLSYLTIADAMEKYPDFDSYFFLMDDCIFSGWLGADLDVSKIWSPKIYFITNHDCGASADLKKGLDGINWEWWPRIWGYVAMRKAFDELPASYKETLAKSWGQNHVVVSFSDFANVPGIYRKQFIELAHIFGKHQAFLETALPTILSCLCPTNEWLWLPLNSTYVQGMHDFKVDFLFNHPIKLSYASNQQFLAQLFAKMRSEGN